MPFVDSSVEVEEVDATRWKLLAPITYRDAQQSITVPPGWVTDFASVPRIFYWLFPTYGTYTKAAILHDFLCDTRPAERDQADRTFRRAMDSLGVPFVRRWMMWAAVRLGGHLKGIGVGEFLLWVAIIVPSAIFLIVPAIVIFVWLALFWLSELVFYVGLRIFAGGGKPNTPTLLPQSPRRTAPITAGR